MESKYGVIVEKGEKTLKVEMMYGEIRELEIKSKYINSLEIGDGISWDE